MLAAAALVAVVVVGLLIWRPWGPVEIASYDLDATDRATCEELVADLPDELADEDRVEVSPDDALGAAYGDPAITVTCGVPVPAEFDQTSRCDEVNGVGWYVPDGSDADPTLDLVLSTPGYRPVVEVVVPSEYRPTDPTRGDDTTAATLSTVSTLVAEHLTREQRCDR